MNSEYKMLLLARVAIVVLLATTLVPEALARDEAPPNSVQGLVAFASGEGLARLARAEEKVDFPALAAFMGSVIVTPPESIVSAYVSSWLPAPRSTCFSSFE